MNRCLKTILAIILVSFFITPVKAVDIKNSFVDWGYVVPISPRQIDTIIIHSSYGIGLDPWSSRSVLRQYRYYDVSVHYLIDRDGRIIQLVDEANIAYHVGSGKMTDGKNNVNKRSIGIEIISAINQPPNNKQYQALANLIRDIKNRRQITYILGHKDVAYKNPTKTDPWNFDWNKLDGLLN